jgi:hypothetical protein
MPPTPKYDGRFADLLNQYLGKEDRNASWLAKRLGMHRSAVGKWLNGAQRPEDMATVVNILSALHIDDADERRAFFDAAGLVYNAPAGGDAEGAARDESPPAPPAPSCRLTSPTSCKATWTANCASAANCPSPNPSRANSACRVWNGSSWNCARRCRWMRRRGSTGLAWRTANGTKCARSFGARRPPKTQPCGAWRPGGSRMQNEPGGPNCTAWTMRDSPLSPRPWAQRATRCARRATRSRRWKLCTSPAATAERSHLLHAGRPRRRQEYLAAPADQRTGPAVAPRAPEAGERHWIRCWRDETAWLQRGSGWLWRCTVG